MIEGKIKEIIVEDTEGVEEVIKLMNGKQHDDTFKFLDLAELKQALRIDNDYNDNQIQILLESANASLLATIGYNEDSIIIDKERFNKLLKTFEIEYVRAFYFSFDNQRVLDALQMQLQALIE